MLTITAVIITLNEEANLERCLNSLQWVDEIVVVDSCSTDRTLDIARRFTDKVISQPWLGYSEQKNMANRYATSDWILSIDADEEVAPELRAEIAAVMQSSLHNGFRIPTLNFSFGRFIRHGGWYPQYHTRLFRNGAGQWQHKVHEEFVVTGTIGDLREPLHHYSHTNISIFLEKMNHYTTLEVEKMVAAKQRPSLLKAFVLGPVVFLYKYVYKRGFLDGWQGFALALLLGVYHSVKHLKYWEWWSSHEST